MVTCIVVVESVIFSPAVYGFENEIQAKQFAARFDEAYVLPILHKFSEAEGKIAIESLDNL